MRSSEHAEIRNHLHGILSEHGFPVIIRHRSGASARTLYQSTDLSEYIAISILRENSYPIRDGLGKLGDSNQTQVLFLWLYKDEHFAGEIADIVARCDGHDK